MMKTLCIYHSIDLDGWMSAAIIKLYHELKERDISFMGYNYGDPIPDVSGYGRIIMCDISFPADEMEKIATSGIGIRNFIWIDHHISAINNIAETRFAKQANGLRNTKFAACELTWMHYFPGADMPEIVRLLGRYDCFGHKGTTEEESVLQFQYAARAFIKTYEDAFYYLVEENRNEYFFERGEAIYEYLKTEAQKVYEKKFPMTLRGYKFCAINKDRFNPINFGIDYHKDGYDGFACFHYENGEWKFSLYNDNGLLDVSDIAKEYGGGGHFGAARFILKHNEFNKIIKK